MYGVIAPGSISRERGDSAILCPRRSAALGVQWCGELQILVGYSSVGNA